VARFTVRHNTRFHNVINSDSLVIAVKLKTEWKILMVTMLLFIFYKRIVHLTQMYRHCLYHETMEIVLHVVDTSGVSPTQHVYCKQIIS